MKATNLALRFLLELALLAALAYWGWHEEGAVLAVVLPLAAAAVWGVFVAPKRRVELPRAARLVLELALFALAVAGLVTSGSTALGIAFGAVVAANEILLSLWGQR